MVKCDFSGWATRNNLTCTDGRTIRKNAFKDCDGMKVPLVYQHDHNDVDNVLGHAILENRDEGVYAYCTLNDTESGKTAKELVRHGDVRSLSIYANKLKEVGGNVIHGTIRELSLVLAGANPGAYIDFVMAHSDDGTESLSGFEASYDENIMLHSSDDVIEHTACKEDDGKKEEKPMANEAEKKEEKVESKEPEKKEEAKAEPEKKEEKSGKTVEDVINSMTPEQKDAMYALIGQALSEKEKPNEAEVKHNEEDDTDMKKNLFEGEVAEDKNVLSHDAMNTIITDGKRFGSLKESFLAHAEEYGIENIEYMFPDARNLNTPPEFISRKMEWVQKVIGGTHHTPFSRIKSMFADITEDDARARGYIKGNLKKEEVFSLLKRTTTPTTIYKKQKLDRDDVIDITDFDVVAWLKSEMRTMLDEEIARAILIGDGRLSSSDDKINEDNIRPIWKDAALYTIKKKVSFTAGDSTDAKAKKCIQAIVRSRKDYKGSGNPVLFTTEDFVTDCLLMEDTQGRVIYDTVDKLKTALRVSDIVTVEVMENQTRTGIQAVDGDTDTRTLVGILVNLADYNIGADKGGAINMFDDFDIDYNQQKYLIETRCSGALIKPYSAIAIESVQAS